MNTRYLSAEDPKTAAIAANIIMQGGLVAIPTETVYGLGADGLNPDAVARIFVAKGRPQDNPLILHISGPEQIELFCHHIPQKAYDLAEKEEEIHYRVADGKQSRGTEGSGEQIAHQHHVEKAGQPTAGEQQIDEADAYNRIRHRKP